MKLQPTRKKSSKTRIESDEVKRVQKRLLRVIKQLRNQQLIYDKLRGDMAAFKENDRFFTRQIEKAERLIEPKKKAGKATVEQKAKRATKPANAS
jgi:hypothetical protein